MLLIFAKRSASLRLTWLFVWGTQSHETELLRLLHVIQDQRHSVDALYAPAALRHETQLETKQTHFKLLHLEEHTVCICCLKCIPKSELLLV